MLISEHCCCGLCKTDSKYQSKRAEKKKRKGREKKIATSPRKEKLVQALAYVHAPNIEKLHIFVPNLLKIYLFGKNSFFQQNLSPLSVIGSQKTDLC